MEYDGYTVGPNLRQLRTDRKLTLEQVSELTGLSTSSIKQLEQGGRNLSMNSLFLFMAAYECDANTLLNIKKKVITDNDNKSVDARLELLPGKQSDYLKRTFLYMLNQAEMLVS